MEVVPDDFALIEDRLHHFVDDGCDLIFTTGGTGLTPDDVTPEATRAVIEREAPGFAEAMRGAAVQITPHGILSRGISGIAGMTLIVNFPGSPKAVQRALPGHRARRWPTPCAPCGATPGMAPAIELEDVGRAYGERTALAGVTLTLEPGRTLAVFGANGAGKTTLLRILATLLRPHAGRARVLGRDLPRRAGRCAAGSGCSAHDPLLYRELTARENLRFHARLHGVDRARIDELLERVGLQRARPTSRCARSRAAWPSGSRSAAPCCTSPSCCCSTSRSPTSTPPRPRRSSR